MVPRGGTVNTVDLLIKVGTMVEKDCSLAKECRQKVNQQNANEKGPGARKTLDKSQTKKSGVAMVQKKTEDKGGTKERCGRG